MEYVKYGKIHSKNRYFKVGDVIKWTPSYVKSKDIDSRGLGIVVKAEGTKFEAYWTGDGEVRKADAIIPGQFVLQDIAPIPQVKEYVDNIMKEYV